MFTRHDPSTIEAEEVKWTGNFSVTTNSSSRMRKGRGMWRVSHVPTASSIPQQRGEKPRRVNDNVSTPLPFGPTLRPELLSLFFIRSLLSSQIPRLHNKINTQSQRPNILRPSNYPTRTASFAARDIPGFDRFRTVYFAVSHSSRLQRRNEQRGRGKIRGGKNRIDRSGRVVGKIIGINGKCWTATWFIERESKPTMKLIIHVYPVSKSFKLYANYVLEVVRTDTVNESLSSLSFFIREYQWFYRSCSNNLILRFK